MSSFKICKNKIHIYPFPRECPSIEHEDCDESFTAELNKPDKPLDKKTPFPYCPFCFPKN